MAQLSLSTREGGQTDRAEDVIEAFCGCGHKQFQIPQQAVHVLQLAWFYGVALCMRVRVRARGYARVHVRVRA